MNVNCFTKIGAHHPICQDYSFGGMVNEKPLCIISDGCSSAKDTDWGSRLLVNALKNQLSKSRIGGLHAAYCNATNVAATQSKALSISQDALKATLLNLQLVEDFIEAGLWGDGYVIARERESKNLVVCRHFFSTNAPYYPFYHLCQANQALYLQHFGAGVFNRTKWLQYPDTIGSKFTMEYAVKDIVDDPLKAGFYTFSIKSYDLVAIASDGLDSFMEKKKTATQITNEFIEPERVITELFGFKGFQGPFVERRCNRAFQEFHERGWTNFDDFSLGVIYCD